jgi:hypothetical protein
MTNTSNRLTTLLYIQRHGYEELEAAQLSLTFGQYFTYSIPMLQIGLRLLRVQLTQFFIALEESPTTDKLARQEWNALLYIQRHGYEELEAAQLSMTFGQYFTYSIPMLQIGLRLLRVQLTQFFIALEESPTTDKLARQEWNALLYIQRHGYEELEAAQLSLTFGQYFTYSIPMLQIGLRLLRVQLTQFFIALEESPTTDKLARQEWNALLYIQRHGYEELEAAQLSLTFGQYFTYSIPMLQIGLRLLRVQLTQFFIALEESPTTDKLARQEWNALLYIQRHGYEELEAAQLSMTFGQYFTYSIPMLQIGLRLLRVQLTQFFIALEESPTTDKLARQEWNALLYIQRHGYED